MPLTDAQICTIALARVGEKQAIDNLNADTTAAKLCNAIYQSARDTALEEAWWSFAKRRAVLAVLADDSSDTEARANSPWTYVYALPADCLLPRYIETGLPNPAPDQRIPFELEDDATEGRLLLTNQEEAELVYTMRQTNPGKFSPKFSDALAWRIAYELCFSLPVKPSVGERAMQMYRFAIADAAASDRAHQTPSPPPKPASVRARS